MKKTTKNDLVNAYLYDSFNRIYKIKGQKFVNKLYKHPSNRFIIFEYNNEIYVDSVLRLFQPRLYEGEIITYYADKKRKGKI